MLSSAPADMFVAPCPFAFHYAYKSCLNASETKVSIDITYDLYKRCNSRDHHIQACLLPSVTCKSSAHLYLTLALVLRMYLIMLFPFVTVADGC